MKSIFGTLLVYILVVGLSGCSHNVDSIPPAPGPYCLSDSIYKGLEIAEAKDSLVANLVQLNGTVTFNQDQVQNVFPLVSGTVVKVNAALGDYVHKGEDLATIKSAELVGFSVDLTNAETNLAIAKKAYDATSDLYKSGLAAQKDLLAAEVGVEQAQAFLTRTKALLAINEGSGKSETFAVKAPTDGFIVAKNITDNMKLRPDNGNALFTISDLKTVWIIGNAYESDIDKIKVGDLANITTLTYAGKVFTGKVDKIFNALDPVNKVMQVRVSLQNSDFKLKPAMYARVSLSSSVNKSLMPYIPEKSIVFENSKNYVLVTTDKCSIQVREVRLGPAADGNVFITSGLKAGERVIASNQLYIYQGLNMNR